MICMIPGQGHMRPGIEGKRVVYTLTGGWLAAGITNQSHQPVARALGQEAFITVSLVQHVSVIVHARHDPGRYGDCAEIVEFRVVNDTHVVVNPRLAPLRRTR